MNIAGLSIKRPITLIMVMIAVMLAGGLALIGLPVDLYPKLEIPTANISVVWAGASPSQIESQITAKVEAAVAAVPDVESVTSLSRTGASVVTVQFSYGTDMDQATLAIRDKMDRLRRQLPADAETPVVTKTDPSSLPVMTIALHGPVEAEILRSLADTTVSTALQQADGVASVQVSGGRTREIVVEADPVKLAAYNMTVTQLAASLNNDNISLDAGKVDKGDLSIPLHFSGEYRSVEEIGSTRIAVGKGQYVPLRNLAQVRDTWKETASEVRFNGETSVSLSVQKQSDGNTMNVAESAKAALEDIRPQLPAGAELSIVTDQSVFIGQSIRTVVEHTLLGGGFAVLILLLFLGNIRATLVISLVIPVSVMGTFGLMSVSSQTLNTITLGGLALGLGSLVDFAVVVLESIFRKRSQGLPAREAAILGTREVGTAVTASALAQIVVFLPTLFVSGLVQQIFMPLALVVIFSHIAALAGALTLVPMFAVYLLNKDIHLHDKPGFSWNPLIWFGRGINRLTSAYVSLLRWSLRHRWVIYGATALILIFSLFLVKQVGRELLPRTDDGQIRLTLEAPAGTAFEETNRIAAEWETLLAGIPEVDRVFTTVGSAGGNNQGGAASSSSAGISIQLVPMAERSRSTEQVAEDLRSLAKGVAGVKTNVSVSSAMRMGGGGSGTADVQINLYGPDMDTLRKLSGETAAAIVGIPGIRDVQNSLGGGLPQYELRLDREAAAYYGFTTKEIAAALRTAYQGTVATQYKDGNDQIDVTVRYPSDYTANMEHIQSLLLISSTGNQVQLSQLAAVEQNEGPAVVKRVGQERNASVSASVSGTAVGSVSKEVKAAVSSINMPAGYRAEMGGQQSEMAKSFKSLGLMLILSVVLVYMVMAGQFESLSTPFVILFSLPPTFSGAALGLYLTDRTMNMSSIIGMVMLVGLVVNNAVVLIDYTLERKREGMDTQEALLEAGKIRLRPILMTAGATVLAMLPLVIGGGEGSESQASMATVVSFGLTLSTLITLLLVPVTYSYYDSLQTFVRRRKRTSKLDGHGIQPDA